MIFTITEQTLSIFIDNIEKGVIVKDCLLEILKAHYFPRLFFGLGWIFFGLLFIHFLHNFFLPIHFFFKTLLIIFFAFQISLSQTGLFLAEL